MAFNSLTSLLFPQGIVTNSALLYLLAFGGAAALAFLSAPVFRWIALRYGVIDLPNTAVKTHKVATPYLGGCAIALAFFVSLTVMRQLSNFPVGTLRPIQGIFFGGFLILLLGLVDDTVAGGLSFKEKFLVQFVAASILLFFDIKIQFVHPRWLAYLLTVIWVTGIMNAINIIDIMDGLAGGTAMIAALSFYFISLPTEHIYVNFVAITLAGSILGFLPYNFSKKRKMFMGDTGSLFIGYTLAALSLGTSYSIFHNAAVLAPVLILAVPLYDTFFVMLIRYRKGLNPFLGSKDHFALRLEKMGFTRPSIFYIAIGISLACGFCAWLTTWIWFWWAVALYALVFLLAYFGGVWLAKVKVEA